jgi:hypothetical protein
MHCRPATRTTLQMIPRPTCKDLAILIVVLAATVCVIVYGLHWRFGEQFEQAPGEAGSSKSPAPDPSRPP